MASNSRAHSPSNTSALSWVSLICGIVGFFTFGIVLGPVALITGWIAMGKHFNSGNVPAMIGFVLGLIITVLAIIALISGAAVYGMSI
ncbi:small hydrophobic protein [Streptomyces sp. NPDC054887]